MVLIIVIDWILIRDVFFFGFNLDSSRVSSFYNESHTFLSEKLRINFLILSRGIFYESEIFSWYSDSISLLISIVSGAKG